MAETPKVAMMPTTDWIAICRAVCEELGVDFAMCSGDIPELLQEIADRAMAREG